MDFKVPPQNMEAEESILCGCLTYQEIADEAVELLTPADFYKPAHSLIFSEIRAMKASGKPVDLVTVTHSLTERGLIERAGGVSYLSELLSAPVPVNVPYYASMVKSAAVLRETISLCHSVAGQCFDGGKAPAEIIAELQSKSLSLGAESIDDFTPMSELSKQSLDRYESLRTSQSGRFIKTGFSLLDSMTGGFRGSSLIILAARPGIGKTAMMCNMVENMSRAGVKIGVFELEMDKESLDDRWNASLADINTVRLTSTQKLDSDEWGRLVEVAGRKSQWPVWIDDTGGMSVGEICRRARKMKRLGCQIIFIDQLSFIRGDKKKSVFEVNTENVEALGQLKKELRMPVVLLAQLNRELEKRGGEKKPILSDLKNTGMLEEAADMVLLGYRRFPYTKLETDEHHAEWELAKNRGGPTMNMEMVWMPKQARFGNIENFHNGVRN